MKRLVAYVAHPVGGDVAGNLLRVRRWLRWLIANHPDISFVIPWLPYCEVLDDADSAQRARGMADGAAVLRKCDLLVLVGGRMSEGMKAELALAQSLAIPIISHLHLGEEPPGNEVAVEAANPLRSQLDAMRETMGRTAKELAGRKRHAARLGRMLGDCRSERDRAIRARDEAKESEAKWRKYAAEQKEEVDRRLAVAVEQGELVVQLREALFKSWKEEIRATQEMKDFRRERDQQSAEIARLEERVRELEAALGQEGQERAAYLLARDEHLTALGDRIAALEAENARLKAEEQEFAVTAQVARDVIHRRDEKTAALEAQLNGMREVLEVVKRALENARDGILGAPNRAGYDRAIAYITAALTSPPPEPAAKECAPDCEGGAWMGLGPCSCGANADAYGRSADEAEGLPDLALLRKLDSGEGGRRTGDLIRRGWIRVEVTEAGRAALDGAGPSDTHDIVEEAREWRESFNRATRPMESKP